MKTAPPRPPFNPPHGPTAAPAPASKPDQRKFLKVTDLHKEGPTACTIGAPFRILSREFDGKPVFQLVVACVLDTGAVFDWGIRLGSQAFIAVEKQLGKNLMLWDEKTVTLVQEPMRDGSGSYIAVQTVE